MKTVIQILLLSLLALTVSSCGRGYLMHYSEPYGYTEVHERTYYPAVYVGTPYTTYSRPMYVGANTGHYGGRGFGGGMH